jgi:hypothetical protein
LVLLVLKRVLAVTLATVVILFAGLDAIEVAEANLIPYPSRPSTELPTLLVRTPKNYSDYYADNTFKLDFLIIKPGSWNSYYKGFALIGQYMLAVYLDGTRSLPQRFPRSDTVTDYTATFSNLTGTEHVVHIVVVAQASYMAYYTTNGKTVSTGMSNDTYITQTVHFQIEPNSKTVSFQKYPLVMSRDPYPNPPILIPTVISPPQNITYTTGNITQFTIPLDFTINATASWIGYSIDNQTRITINGNMTLSELKVGSHNITLFASDIFGNIGTSNITYFTITEKVAANSGFQPTVLALPIVVVVLAVGVILFRKYRGK